ncbi:MAG: DUF4390 domain-containing protein [Syntrophales bacterium]
MLTVKPLLVTCLLAFSLFFAPSSLQAQKASIADLLVTNGQTNLLLYARVADCFNSEIEDAILAGVPTAFTFQIHLYKERSWFPNKKIINIEIHHTIKYDNVKKIFNVSVDNQKTWVNFPDFENAKRMMAEVNAVPLAGLGALTKNEYYLVKLKAKLDKVRLPLHLEYLFFFISSWDFETDWRQERFLF